MLEMIFGNTGFMVASLSDGTSIMRCHTCGRCHAVESPRCAGNPMLVVLSLDRNIINLGLVLPLRMASCQAVF